jgi:hypothetical protein
MHELRKAFDLPYDLAGRTAEGYFELLFEWIGRQRGAEAKDSWRHAVH